jgi:hypothetical protein
MSLTKLSLAGNNLSIPDQGEFGQWHPGWGRENRYPFFYSVPVLDYIKTLKLWKLTKDEACRDLPYFCFWAEAPLYSEVAPHLIPLPLLPEELQLCSLHLS